MQKDSMYSTRGNDDDDDRSILGGESSDEEEDMRTESMSIRSGSTVSNRFEKVKGNLLLNSDISSGFGPTEPTPEFQFKDEKYDKRSNSGLPSEDMLLRTQSENEQGRSKNYQTLPGAKITALQTSLFQRVRL